MTHAAPTHPAADPRSLRRLEDARFLRGAGRYVDDLPAAGQLHAVFVRSPHAHASITRIDARAAAGLLGHRSRMKPSCWRALG